MRRAFLANADSTDILTAMDVAYERTGRYVDRLRASADTMNDIARDEGLAYRYTGPSNVMCLVGIPFEVCPDVPRGVVEVTWRKRPTSNGVPSSVVLAVDPSRSTPNKAEP